MIRVLVTADIRLYREGLRNSLDRLPDITVVATAASSAAALRAVDEWQPDVVVVDLGMSEGTALLRELGRRDLRLVALTVPESEHAMFECAEAGVVGYVGREGSFKHVVRAIRAASRNEVACEPQLAATLVRAVHALGRAQPLRTYPSGGRPGLLTRRELEIARLIAFEGLANKQIAQHLCIELPTVKNHVHNILAKLDVKRRSEAAARLRELDLVQKD